MWRHYSRTQECIPVGCVPSAAAAVGGGGVSAGGVHPGVYLGGDVCSWGGVCPGGCLHRGGGVLPRGCMPRGVSPKCMLGYTHPLPSASWDTHPSRTEWQTLVKTLPLPFVADGNKSHHASIYGHVISLPFRTFLIPSVGSTSVMLVRSRSKTLNRLCPQKAITHERFSNKISFYFTMESEQFSFTVFFYNNKLFFVIYVNCIVFFNWNKIYKQVLLH